MPSDAQNQQKTLLTRTTEQPYWFMGLLWFNTLMLLWHSIYRLVSGG